MLRPIPVRFKLEGCFSWLAVSAISSRVGFAGSWSAPCALALLSARLIWRCCSPDLRPSRALRGSERVRLSGLGFRYALFLSCERLSCR